MDALDLLKADHDRVISMFDQFKNTQARQQQILLFENMRTDLEVHSMVEEQVFYPAFKLYPEFEDIIADSFEEHRQVKEMLKKISALPDGSEGLVGAVNQLIGDVTRHVQEEESELFPMVRKIMKRAERERLGRHMQAVKETGMGAAA